MERVHLGERLASVALFATSLLGCSDVDIDERFAGKTWESEHYRYRYQEGDAMACEGVLETLETYGGLIARLLDVSGDERTQTSYYKYPSRQSFEDAAVCRSTASACTDGDRLFTTVPVAGHELVHTIMAEHTGTDVSLLLAEGLANALTCDPHSAPADSDWDFREFKSRPDEHDLAQAGRLVLGILQHLTAAELISLIAATNHDDGPERVQQMLLERHGIDLEDIQQQVETDGTSSCIPIFACSGEPLSLGKSQLTLDCRGPSRARLPVDQPALAIHVNDARVRFMPCDWSHSASPLAGLWPYYAIGSLQYWVQTPNTPHALWLDSAERSLTPLAAEVELAPLPAAFAPQCDLEQAYSLTSTEQLAIVIDGRTPVMHFPLAFSQPARLSLAWQNIPDPDLMRVPAEPVAVSYCRSCIDGIASDCTELEGLDSERRLFDVAEPGVIVVRPSAPLVRAAVLEVALRTTE